ncbi:MAG TPA: DUF6456 domain-containing protein [Aestuariivirgaceae bacterium]
MKQGNYSPRPGRLRPERLIVRKSIAIEPGTRLVVDFNCAESPLSWLRMRKDGSGRPLISAEQHGAGLRLHGDFMTAALGPRTTSAWIGPVGYGDRRSCGDLMHDGERALAARQRYHRALDAVGPELSGILVEICCHATGIEAAERMLGLPRRSGKVVLDLALTRLTRFYGMIASSPAAGGDEASALAR